MSIHKQLQKDFTKLVARAALANSYLFYGPDSGAKQEFATGLATYLETGKWPEEQGSRPLTDARVFEPVEGTIGIDVAREVREFLGGSPLISSRRTAIIAGAEALTSEAQGALLKLAEEPPARALLLFLLRDPEALLPTLISRLQKLYVPGSPARTLQGTAGEAKAREFLAAPPSARKEFLKELLEPEEFSLTVFLDDLIRVLGTEKKLRSDLWHAVLELRRSADTAPLNPKIQLLSLWTHT